MKSVKQKLFVGYALTISIILLSLTIVTIYYFEQNQETKQYERLDGLYYQIEETILDRKNIDFNRFDQYINLKNEVLLIFKNQTLLFTNQSDYKTQRIIQKINLRDKFHEAHESDEEKEYEILSGVEHYDKGFIELEEFLFNVNYLEKDDFDYAVFVGINEDFEDESLEDIIVFIIILIFIIYAILLFLGYMLIHKTIKPLKLILSEVETLRTAEDLSQRLHVQKSNDEFETLSITFNSMLENIEKSIESIKQFSSDASHELKTPLTIIQGQIELCQKENITIDELKQCIATIDKEQKKLQEIIQNFLLLSRIDKEKIYNEKASLDGVVFEAIENNLSSLEAKGLELQLNIDEGIEVSFNAKYLYMVINNLLNNAIKYTQSGFVKISVKQHYVEITDSGIGIAKEDCERIFERFYRVDKVRSQYEDGIGLGLAIVKKICEHFEARISLNSEVNKGSSFKIVFK